jgi:hypothetical protein
MLVSVTYSRYPHLLLHLAVHAGELNPASLSSHMTLRSVWLLALHSHLSDIANILYAVVGLRAMGLNVKPQNSRRTERFSPGGFASVH